MAKIKLAQNPITQNQKVVRSLFHPNLSTNAVIIASMIENAESIANVNNMIKKINENKMTPNLPPGICPNASG